MIYTELITTVCVVALSCISMVHGAAVIQDIALRSVKDSPALVPRRSGGVSSPIDMSTPPCIQYKGEYVIPSDIDVLSSTFNNNAATYTYLEGAIKGSQQGKLPRGQFSFILDGKGYIQLMTYDRRPGTVIPKDLMIQLKMRQPTLPIGWYINTEKAHTCHLHTGIKREDVMGFMVKHK